MAIILKVTPMITFLMGCNMNEFEKKLQEFFPDLYAVHQLTRDRQSGGGGQAHLLDILQAIVQLNKVEADGSIHISLVKGELSAMSIKVDQNWKKIDKENLTKLK